MRRKSGCCSFMRICWVIKSMATTFSSLRGTMTAKLVVAFLGWGLVVSYMGKRLEPYLAQGMMTSACFLLGATY